MTPLPETSRWLAEYLAELSLQEYEFLSYKPSLVATCAISLALHCTDQEHWYLQSNYINKHLRLHCLPHK
jgi:hypothetical protein